MLLNVSYILSFFAVFIVGVSNSVLPSHGGDNMHRSNFLQPQKRYNLFAYSCFSYSHCLETFGAVQMLVDSGQFDATILVTGPCDNLAERARNVSLFPEQLNVIKTEQISKESLQNVSLLFKAIENSCIMCDSNLFELDKRPEDLRNFIDTGDEPLRRNNFSRVESLHRQRRFDVVLCDGFSPACFEFADRNGLVAIYIAVQGPPLPSEMNHNGLWLSACPRINGSLASSCSLRQRLAVFIAYYYNTRSANFVMDNVVRRIFTTWNGLDPRTAFGMVNAIRKLSHSLRVGRNDVPPMRVEYPSIDQRILGTTVVPAYYRPDHIILGPTWLKLVNTEFDHSNIEHRQLVEWLERAQQPVVFVSFGTNARLSRHETRVVLEGIVSEKWQTVWKITNMKFLQEILAGASEYRLDDKVRSLIEKSDALQALEWAPQLALLRHSKVKAFVTHGGLSSIMEACASSVPMVCVPLFGDQPVHCAQLSATGNAVPLRKTDVTSATLRNSIKTLLFSNDSSRFQQKADQIARYHSRIDTPSRLKEFVQHYAEFKYEFIETSNDYYGWYTYWGLDFILFVGSILVLALTTVFFTLKLLALGVALIIIPTSQTQYGKNGAAFNHVDSGGKHFILEAKPSDDSCRHTQRRRSSSTSSLTIPNNKNTAA